MNHRHHSPRRHMFGFDRIMDHPDYRRFPDWYARQSRLAPSGREVEAIFSKPARDRDA
jgi:hypothetical protein